MASLTVIRNPAEEALIARFPAAKASLPGNSAISALRERAFGVVRDKGLPHRRIEAYKYTDLRALMRDAAPLATEASGEGAATPLVDGARLVFTNGWLSSNANEGSMPVGVTATRMKDALIKGHPLIDAWFNKAAKLGGDDPALALNAAFMTDGVILQVADGAEIERPILLEFNVEASTPVAVYPRILVAAGRGARATIIEHHRGPDGVATQANSVFELILGESADIQHVRLDETGNKALSLSSFAAHLGKESLLSSLNFSSNPATARHQVFATFAGRDAKASIRGAALLRGAQHADTTLVVDHVEPGGESRELYRTVLDGDSTGVFQGKIIVQQKAQKTDGRMASNALMLSDGATMNNKPELEIFADDVQCAHGATVGALDDNLLFYLMARGISRKEAEALMIASFAGEPIEPVSDESLRAALTARIDAWLKVRAA
ncbi:MAG: Fe-S cluster assembly protein SufD [Beijerinckiaceae bacterium]